MKHRFWIVTSLLLLTVSPISALDFQANDVAQTDQGTSVEISYPDTRPVVLGEGLQLPAETYFYRLSPGEKASDISGSSTSPRFLRKIESSDIYRDTPTGEFKQTEQTRSLTKLDKIGSKVCYPVREIGVHDDRYAEVLIFPVTCDDEGNLWFHDKIDLKVGSRPVQPEELISEEEFKILCSDSYKSLNLSKRLSGSPEYVIITCPSLAATVLPLVNYKNETGYITELKIIDDILAEYSGRDDAERVREYLKDFYAGGGRYVLLIGDETNLVVRYAYHYKTDGDMPLWEQQICDLYFADIDGDWDVDSDGVWGEKYDDNADLSPELSVGRLPFSDTSEVKNYIEKLILYETGIGMSDPSYFTKSFFFSSDQMRDYGTEGQHGRVLEAFPDNFTIDTTNGVELASGDDVAPTNLAPSQLTDIMQSGFGMINVLAHGRHDGFVVRSSGYNEWPKAFFLSMEQQDVHGSFDSIANPDKPAFYYSVGCDNGAFDFDQPEGAHAVNMAQYLLGERGGAVAFIGQSRWGWVSSSYLIQKEFYKDLFAHPELPAIDAMNSSKDAFIYYRDIALGQNYYGDPTLKIHTTVPGRLTISCSKSGVNFKAKVTLGEVPIPDCRVIVAQNGQMLDEYITDNDGQVIITSAIDQDKEHFISAVKDDYFVARFKNVLLTLTDVADDDDPLPYSFRLLQNYPNPFNPTTTIAFELAHKSRVELAVYNVLGQKVAVLANEDRPAGMHQVLWDGCNDDGREVSSGIYFYRITTEDYSSTRKMLLLR